MLESEENMESNGKILRELVESVKDLRMISRNQEKINRGLQEMLQSQQEQLHEHRWEAKAAEKRWQKLYLDHERWLKDHEVRLRSHYQKLFP